MNVNENHKITENISKVKEEFEKKYSKKEELVPVVKQKNILEKYISTNK
jgi:hypothetical protein